MGAHRNQRLNEQLRREITGILRSEIRDPRVALATVTEVAVTSDLWLARVYVRLTGEDAQRREALAGLESAAPYVRRLLGRRLHVRRIPEIRFLEDETADQAGRIDEILRGLREEWEDTDEDSASEEE
jgi:ribosome-binding factor A